MALVRRSRDMRPGDDGYINVPEGETMMTLEGHTSYVKCVIQLADGRIVSASSDKKIKIWNIMSLSEQKWIRRRLLVLLFEASKILSEPPESKVIRQDHYPSLRLLDTARCYDLELLLRCSLNISNDNKNDNKTFKVTLTVLSMPEIAVQVTAFL